MAELGIEGVTDAVKIGSGGTATVYRATEARLGRQVAVKILHINLGAGNEAERRRFAASSWHSVGCPICRGSSRSTTAGSPPRTGRT